MTNKSKIVSIALSVLIILTLAGCTESSRVNYNIKNDADNFKVKRKLIALNTRTNEALFTVEGYLSIGVDNDGDLNVTIKTGDDDYKLFYAHLSDDVTYTSVQMDGSDVTPYAYQISFFPVKEAIEHGLLDVTSTD